MADVIDFPTADPVPPVTGDLYLDALEVLIIRGISEMIHGTTSLAEAVGLARAREMYLRHHPELGSAVDSRRMVSSLLVRIRDLPARQQAKLRHPVRDRRDMQTILTGGA